MTPLICGECYADHCSRCEGDCECLHPPLEPVYCDICGHDPHEAPCRFTRTLYVTVQTGAVKQVCGCRERAA